MLSLVMKLFSLEVAVAIVVGAVSIGLVAHCWRSRLKAEVAARRTKLDLPATATDQECAVREDGIVNGELAACCVEWQLRAVPDQLAVAVRRLALAALLQDRLAEDSPARAAGGVYGWCVRVAAATEAVRAVRLHVQRMPPNSNPANDRQ